jgi:hypothetical protein
MYSTIRCAAARAIKLDEHFGHECAACCMWINALRCGDHDDPPPSAAEAARDRESFRVTRITATTATNSTNTAPTTSTTSTTARMSNRNRLDGAESIHGSAHARFAYGTS